QLDSLREFHAIFSDLPGKLSETKGEDIADLFQAHHPEWASNGIFPEMTFALATSVGKTRLMGALMSYLFTSGESRNFLILAPRTTIVDKLIRECNAHHAKYIFVDSVLISQP